MARQEEVVLDASVAVKWFSEEEGTQQALKMKDDHIEGIRLIFAPDLIIYELSNALRFKPGFDAPRVARAVNDLLDLQIDFVAPTEELVRRSSELAFRYGITTYDSCYLALGELLGIQVFTSDEQFYERAKDCGFLRLIETSTES